MVIDKPMVTPDNLPGLVGKEAAERTLAKEPHGNDLQEEFSDVSGKT